MTSRHFIALAFCVLIFQPLRAVEPAPPATSEETPATKIFPPKSAFGLDEVHARAGFPNLFAKLKGDGDVSFAYLGGSITAAAGWRVLSLDWLREQYPAAHLIEINAAISGTPSSFGAFRVGREVLLQKPDLLFVEFAVNDGGGNPERTRRAMEGIVRQTWRANPKTDICFVYTLAETDLKTIQSGKLQVSAENMERVAEHYGIPSIHFGVEVARLEKDGKLIFTAPLPKTPEDLAKLGDKIVFTGDKVHPHVATGHPLYLAAIQRAWEPIKLVSTGGAHILPEPLDALNWENARLVPIADVKREGEWQQLTADALPVKNAGHALPPLWSAGKKGDALTFKFKGRAFGLYSLKGPDAGNFRVTVDDLPPVEAAQFDSYCVTGRWRISPWIYPNELPAAEHTVRIELLGTSPDKVAILKPKNVTITNAEQRDATNLHASDVMVLGEMLP